MFRVEREDIGYRKIKIKLNSMVLFLTECFRGKKIRKLGIVFSIICLPNDYLCL